MAEKDQLEALKKLNARARAVSSGSQSALPEAGKALQAGSAADLQANVGNAGLNQMIGHEAGQNDVGRMGPNELAAHAKKAGGKVAKQRGDGPKAKAGAADGERDGKKQKEAAALEKEAQRHKAEAAREKKAAADKKAALTAAPAKAAPKKSVAAPGKSAKKSGKKSDEQAGGQAGKPEAKQGPTATNAKQKVLAGGAAPSGDKKRVAEARAGAAEKGGKKAGKSGSQPDQGEAPAADKKAKAKSVRAEATQVKAQVAAKEVSKAAEAKGGKVGDPSKQTLVVNKEKQAVKAELDAEQADRTVLAKKQTKTAAPASTEPKVTADRGGTAGPDGQGGVKGPSPEPQKDGRALAAATTTQSRTEQADEAAKKLAKVEDEKVKALGKVESSPDTAARAAHAAEAEAKAKEVEAAGSVAAQKLAAEDKARLEEESPASEATLKEISRSSELDSADGERITLVGTYVPRPTPGGNQMLGHVSILVGNHEVRLGVETRGTAEILRLSGERVAVTGTLDLKKASSGQSVAKGKPETRTEKPLLGRPGTVARR
ncbi:MAG: hypothetical protein EXR69_14810 [Myxococcales bacterium]|nr:hypothetical protein [Myxococcales bacterium]